MTLDVNNAVRRWTRGVDVQGSKVGSKQQHENSYAGISEDMNLEELHRPGLDDPSTAPSCSRHEITSAPSDQRTVSHL